MQLIGTVTRLATLTMKTGRPKLCRAIQASDEIGIKVHGIYVEPPGHVAYFVLEADTMEQVVQFFDPMLELGDTDIIQL